MEENAPKLKEGFLVKKGHVRHNWKARWFVLCDETLNYYKKKEDAVPAGKIPLKGCFLVSPCSEYTKKENVFRLTTKEGVAFLIQAANDSEHESWVTAIADVISILGSKQRVNKSTSNNTGEKASLPSTAHLSDILVAMQDSEAGIPLGVQPCDKKSKQHKLSFTGAQAVDWLLKWSFISSREEGAILVGMLLELGHLQLGGSVKEGADSGSIRDSKVFHDDQNTLYQFSALRLSSTEGVDLDYSDDTSDSGEETGKEQWRAIRGTIVKQGFLQKKGHVRHNWKTRKAILCTDPPTLYYCRPTKESAPVGRINVKDGEVKNVDSYEESVPSDSPSGQRRQLTEHLFKLRTRKGVKYVFKVTSENERLDWVQHLQSVCQGNTVHNDEDNKT